MMDENLHIVYCYCFEWPPPPPLHCPVQPFGGALKKQVPREVTFGSGEVALVRPYHCSPGRPPELQLFEGSL